MSLIRALLAFGTSVIFTLAVGGCSEREMTNDAEQQSNAPRLITLGGELSETVVALGFEDQLVAVDSTSLWPERLQRLPNVGYLRQLNTEGILALSPDLILASHEAGPESVLDQLRALGIPVHTVTTGPDLRAASTAIATVGELLGARSQSALLIDALAQSMANLKPMENVPRVLFILSKAGNQTLVAGRNTKAHTVISHAGGHNVGAGFDGYKPLSPEAIVQLAPDIILLPSHTAGSVGGREGLLTHRGIQMTPAAERGHIWIIESQTVLSLGPRIGESLVVLNRRFASVANAEVKTAELAR